METVELAPNWEGIALLLAEEYVEKNLPKGNYGPMLSFIETLYTLSVSNRPGLERVINSLRSKSYTAYRIEILSKE